MSEELVKDALANIKAAAEAGDEDTLQKYAMNERASISSAAQKEIDKIDGVDEDDPNLKDQLKEDKEEASTDDWVEMTIEQSKVHLADGTLAGYNPHTEMGLLKS